MGLTVVGGYKSTDLSWVGVGTHAKRAGDFP